MVKGTAHMIEGERVRELGWFSLKRQRDISAASNHLLGGYRDGGARLFSKVHNDRKRSNGYKLERGEF